MVDFNYFISQNDVLKRRCWITQRKTFFYLKRFQSIFARNTIVAYTHVHEFAVFNSFIFFSPAPEPMRANIHDEFDVIQLQINCTNPVSHARSR